MVGIAKMLQTPSLLARWATSIQTRRTAPRRSERVETTAVPAEVGIVQVVGSSDPGELFQVQVTGALDRFLYLELVQCAGELYTCGQRTLLLDLREATRIELSGFFALMSIARLYRGEPLLDPEGGWVALRCAFEQCNHTSQRPVKLLASPPVVQTLRKAGICDFFEIESHPGNVEL